MAIAKPVYCSFCKKELKHQGAKNLHEKKCKENPANKGGTGHEHTWRFLNAKNPGEKRAIDEGYYRICTDKKCDEME
jgi:predicted secreted protein